MDVHVNWMRCKYCGETDVLFYAKKETRKGRKKGRLLIGGKCKLCYLEDKRTYENIKYLTDNGKRKKELEDWNKKNRAKRLKIYRDYRKRHKIKLIERRRLAYLKKKDREAVSV